jgi:enoyl-CoA hydratase/carnithine racemase
MTAELNATRNESTLILTISNPGQHNAVDGDLLAAILETLTKIERDDSVGNVILTGADGSFCSGIQHSKDADGQIRSLDNLHNLIDTMRCFPKPVIAAVEGPALDAGFSLALACDLIVASSDAGFGISPGQIGSWAIGGAAWMLSRTIPAQWLTEILLGTSPVSAARLHAGGIINRVTPTGTALEHAQQWAQQLLGTPLPAYSRLKTMLSEMHASTLASQFSQEKHRLLTRRSGHG